MRRQIPYASDKKPRSITTLELLPEESLYLIERGSMLCFRSKSKMTPDIVQLLDPESDSFAQEPMTVQQSFAEMIEKDHLTLARYQVRN